MNSLKTTHDTARNFTTHNSSDLYWMLVLFYVTFQLVSDVTAGKIISFMGWDISVSVLYFPLTFIIADILTEVYGFAKARRALYCVLMSSICAGVIYQIVIALPPGVHFSKAVSYQDVLGNVPRILCAGWLAVFVGEMANNYAFIRLKILTQGRLLWVRTIGSTIIGQGLNTLIFFFGAFYQALPLGILINAFFMGALFKIMINVLCTPFTYWVIAWIKQK